MFIRNSLLIFAVSMFGCLGPVSDSEAGEASNDAVASLAAPEFDGSFESSMVTSNWTTTGWNQGYAVSSLFPKDGVRTLELKTNAGEYVITSTTVPVLADKQYTLSAWALLPYHYARFSVQWLDSTGAQIDVAANVLAFTSTLCTSGMACYKIKSAVVTAPGGATSARIQITSGASRTGARPGYIDAISMIEL